MTDKTLAEQSADKIIAYALSFGKDVVVCFQDWLQWLISLFSVDNLIKHNADYNAIMNAAKTDHPLFSECLIMWVKESLVYQQQHKCVDFFGEVYEWCFQSKSKASRMGQYFTPYSIGSLMSRCLNWQETSDGIVFCSEPSCGSGRNLLALWQDADWNQKHVFYAEDLDPVSVKMCALNMMINGMIGYVVCHNTLIPDDFSFAYAVNEVRDPMPCDYFSIRQISQEEFNRINPWQPAWQAMLKESKHTVIQKSLFDE